MWSTLREKNQLMNWNPGRVGDMWDSQGGFHWRPKHSLTVSFGCQACWHRNAAARKLPQFAQLPQAYLGVTQPWRMRRWTMLRTPLQPSQTSRWLLRLVPEGLAIVASRMLIWRKPNAFCTWQTSWTPSLLSWNVPCRAGQGHGPNLDVQNVCG